jgi:hypothetical protein
LKIYSKDSFHFTLKNKEGQIKRVYLQNKPFTRFIFSKINGPVNFLSRETEKLLSVS